LIIEPFHVPKRRSFLAVSLALGWRSTIPGTGSKRMPLATVKIALLWCLAFNYAVLLLWFIVITVAHDLLYRISAPWFRVSTQAFDAINYGGLVAYKSFILFFNVVPYVALVVAT
jgi:hypothetical protein